MWAKKCHVLEDWRVSATLTPTSCVNKKWHAVWSCIESLIVASDRCMKFENHILPSCYVLGAYRSARFWAYKDYIIKALTPEPPTPLDDPFVAHVERLQEALA